MSKWTKGHWRWVKYVQDDEDLKRMRSLGIEPVRMLTNEGQVAIMAGDTRIALVDCQTPFKRGNGYRSECETRDAAATLIASAPALVEALEDLLRGYVRTINDSEELCWDPEEASEVIAARAALSLAKGTQGETK